MPDTLRECLTHPFGAPATQRQARAERRRKGLPEEEAAPACTEATPADRRASERTEAEPCADDGTVEREAEPENPAR